MNLSYFLFLNYYSNLNYKFCYILNIMKNSLDHNFIKSLVVIAAGISRDSDPYELVNGVFEYLKKNWEKYEDHPNLKAIAVLKMKALHIDELRKKKRFENTLVNEDGSDVEISDSSQIDVVERIEIKSKLSKVYKTIQNMDEKCREILMLAADDVKRDEMQIIIGVNSLGTVLSRLSKCREELGQRMQNAR